MIDSQSVFVAFDTETTGLSAAEGRVVEIAALKFDFNGQIIAQFSELINPGGPIPPSAIAVHHITDEMVAGKPTIEEALPRFIDFLSGENNILIAQNALFDIGFINHEAIRRDIKLPRNVILDLIDLTKKTFPNLPTYSLENICRRFNLVETQLHRAMADAVLVMKLFRHCLAQYKEPQEALNILNSVYHYSFGGPVIVRTDEAMMAIIVEAMETGGILEIIYSGGSMRGQPRQIMPSLMYNRDGVAYLTAKCLNTNANRQFRLDRIVECRPVNKPSGK